MRTTDRRGTPLHSLDTGTTDITKDVTSARWERQKKEEEEEKKRTGQLLVLQQGGWQQRSEAKGFRIQNHLAPSRTSTKMGLLEDDLDVAEKKTQSLITKCKLIKRETDRKEPSDANAFVVFENEGQTINATTP